MELTEKQQQWLVFAVGFLLSFRSIPKAYAPTVNIPPKSASDCPPNTEFIPAMMTQCYKAPCPPGRPAQCQLLHINPEETPQSRAINCSNAGGIWRKYSQNPSFRNDGGWCDYGRPLDMGKVLYNEAQAKVEVCQTNIWAEKPVLKCPPGTRQYSYTKNAGMLSFPPVCHTCGNEAEIYKQKQLDTIMGIV